MGRRSASITVAGLALGTLLLAGSPAGAQIVYAPYTDQGTAYRQPGYQNSNGWSGHTNSAWGGNTTDPRFDHRDAYQDHRIQQGIDSGAFTPRERRYLEREQGRIDRAEDRMSADGHLSRWERERLNHMQNRASRDIYRLQNNHRTAEGWDGDSDHHRFDRREAYRDHDRDWDRRDYGHNRDWDRRDYGHNRGWDRRDYGRRDHDRGWDRREAGWQGRNHDWDRRNYGWHGNNPVRGAGYTQGNDYNHGWHGTNPNGVASHQGGTNPAGVTGNSGWHGNTNSGWQGHNPGGTTTNGTTTAGYNQGQTNHNSGWQGHNPGGSGNASGGTATAGNTQGGHGNYANHGQPGAYQQPGAQAGARPGQPTAWQGQRQYQRPSFQGQPQMRPGQAAPWQGRQYQQARSPMPQTAMRPNFNMAPRQPMYGGMVNRANYSVGGARRR